MSFRLTLILVFISIVSFSQTPAEQTKKALFMLNITKYVRWEDRSQFGKGFTIGVVRDSEMAGELRQMSENKTILGKKIDIVEFYRIDDIEQCDILYLSDKVFVTDKIINYLNGKIDGHPTLIITDRAERVAMINFFVRNYDNGIIYEVNKRNMENAGILPLGGLLKKKNSRIKEDYP